MPYYKRIEAKIQAVKFENGKFSDKPTWLLRALDKSPTEIGSIVKAGKKLRIKTIEGTLIASDGYYIINTDIGTIFIENPISFDNNHEKLIK